MGLEPVDLSGYFPRSYGRSQLGADPNGPNRLYNCVEASIATCLDALGLGWYDPQHLTDLIYGAGHHGGSDFGYAIDRLQRQGIIPRSIPVAIVNPRLTIQAIHDYLAQGFPVIVEFKDDKNAQLVPQWHADWHGSHASVAVACGPKTISIINVWTDALQTFPHETFRQATLDPAGNLVVFQKSILPAKPAPVPEPKPVVIAPTPVPNPVVVPAVVPAPAPLPAPAPTPEPVPDPVPVIPSPPVTPPVVPEPAPVLPVSPPVVNPVVEPVILSDPPVVNPVVNPVILPIPTITARKVGRSTLILGGVVAVVAALIANIGGVINSLLAGVSVPPVVQVFLSSPNGVALKVALGWIVLDALMTALLEERLGRFDARAMSFFLEKVGGEYIGLAVLGIAGYIVPLMDVGFAVAIAAFITTESTGAKDKIQAFIDSLKKAPDIAATSSTPKA